MEKADIQYNASDFRYSLIEYAYNIISKMQQILIKPYNRTHRGEGVNTIFPRAFFYNSGKRINSVILKLSVAVHPSLSRLSLNCLSMSFDIAKVTTFWHACQAKFWGPFCQNSFLFPVTYFLYVHSITCFTFYG